MIFFEQHSVLCYEHYLSPKLKKIRSFEVTPLLRLPYIQDYWGSIDYIYRINRINISHFFIKRRMIKIERFIFNFPPGTLKNMGVPLHIPTL